MSRLSPGPDGSVSEVGHGCTPVTMLTLSTDGVNTWDLACCGVITPAGPPIGRRCWPATAPDARVHCKDSNELFSAPLVLGRIPRALE